MAKKSKKNFTKKQKSSRSSMMDTIMDNTLKNRGASAAYMDADIHKNFQKGLELPPICLQNLFKTNAFPLEKIMQIHGSQDTCKSSFTLKLAQWFLAGNGLVWYIDTENKLPLDIAKDFMGNFERSNRIALMQPQPPTKQQQKEGDLEDHEYGTIQEAKKIIGEAIYSMRAVNQEVVNHNEKVDNGEISEERWEPVPGLILLDSLAATLPAKDSEKFMDGDYSETMATYAKEWTKFFSDMSSKLAGIWTSFVFINHDRQNLNPYGKSSSQPGGTNKDFLKSYDLQFKKSYSGNSYKKQTESHTSEGQKSLKVELKKSITGPSGLEIEPLNFHWEGLNFEWQFDRCTMNMIKGTNTAYEIGPVPKGEIGKYNKKFKVPSLGIDKYKDPDVAMDKLRESSEFMSALYDIWNIKQMQSEDGNLVTLDENKYKKALGKDTEEN